MPPVSSERRPFPLALAIVLYALAFAVAAWPWLSGSVTIPWDAKSQFFPNLSFLARSLGGGQSPFWTPNVYAGWPQIADPQSLIFSPFHFALAFFNPTPSFRAADAVVFALLFTGGLGIILIFRDRGWHMAGALVAAMAFAFGGSNASRLQHIGQIESLAFLPLALWLLTRALQRSSGNWGFLAGLAAGLIAIGRDQVALLSLYTLTGFVVWYWFDGEGRLSRFRQSIVPLLGGGVAGALVASVPVLLTALLAADSNRPEVSLEIASGGSFHPANLLTLLFADLYGAADRTVDYWGPPSFPWHGMFGSTDLFHAQNIGQLYAGALVAVAVIGLGILRGWLWDRDIRFFIVAMALSLLYALGKYTPAFTVLYEALPGVSLYRRPADATFLFGALLAMAAGYLVHRWLARDIPATRWQRFAEMVVAFAILAGVVSLALTAGPPRGVVMPFVTGVIFIGAAIAALALADRCQHPIGAALVLLVFCTADLAWNNAPNESTGLPPSHYDALRLDTTDETAALLKTRLAATAAPDRRDRVELIGIGYHWPNIGLVHGFDHLFGHNPLRLRAFAAATGVADTVAVPDQRGFSPLTPSYNSPLESLFGVRFIATGVPVEQIDKSLKDGDLVQIARTGDAYVYENPRALPRVMLVGEWRHANFADMLRTGLWPDGADPRSVVLLERPPERFVPGTPGGTARIVSYRNTEVVVETDAPAASLLVLNDVWQPWWRACVDGDAADILKANVLFRAVVVPPGRHTVRFSFHPFAGAFGRLGASGPRC